MVNGEDFFAMLKGKTVKNVNWNEIAGTVTLKMVNSDGVESKYIISAMNDDPYIYPFEEFNEVLREK